MECEKCGILIEKKSNKTKYCPSCAKEIKLENDRRIQRERYNSRKQKPPSNVVISMGVAI